MLFRPRLALYLCCTGIGDATFSWARSDRADADRLVTEADLAYIAGAALRDALACYGLLRRALAAYDAHLALVPTNLAAVPPRANWTDERRD